MPNHLSSKPVPASRERLPVSALLALAMTGFICIATETLPAGLLPQMADGLGVSQALAGQSVATYALGSLVAAIPLTIATQTWSRRSVLLLTVFGFLAFNTLTAVSQNYWLTLVARFFAGAAAGLAWSLLAGYARRMVEPHQQGRAMALAMVGTPVALSFGVPLGTWLGTAMGWRMAFGVMSVFSIALVVWILVAVPNYPGKAGGTGRVLARWQQCPACAPSCRLFYSGCSLTTFSTSTLHPSPRGQVSPNASISSFSFSAWRRCWGSGSPGDGSIARCAILC